MTGHNTSIPAGDPSPPCQYPKCHRRAHFMYVSKVSGLRVFRPWCRPHRSGGSAAGITPLPRVYLPAGQAWPDDIKCPYCPRAREPQADGPRRATCRHCRHRAVAPPVIATPPTVLRRKTPVRTPQAPPPSRPTAPTFTPFVFRESGRREEITVPKKDRQILRTYFEADAGHYTTATAPELSRRYPTAMISALWAQWAACQE